MKYPILIVLLTLFSCGIGSPAQQPSKSKVANNEGIAKGDDTHQGSITEKPKSSQEPTEKVANAPSQPPDPDKTADAERLVEDIEIQRKLVTATIWLVIVGILQAVILGWQAISLSRTIKAINTQAGIMERQTKATETAAKAAELNAEALINSERAWVMVDIENDHGNGQIKAEILSGLAIVCICRNHGKSTAWVTQKLIRMERSIAIPEKPQLEDADAFQDEPEPLAEIPSRCHHVVEPRPVNPSGPTTFIYGVVKYRDIFNRSRETFFGYRHDPTGKLERIAGYPEYNKNT